MPGGGPPPPPGMPIHGNATTFNLENVLRQNILNSAYYRKTCAIKFNTWEEVVDAIFYDVTNVEPWLSGNARGPSTAFCLLHRLFTLGPSVGQVRAMLDHGDSPYIRAVRAIQLSYSCHTVDVQLYTVAALRARCAARVCCACRPAPHHNAAPSTSLALHLSLPKNPLPCPE